MKKIFILLLIVFAINLFGVDPGVSPSATFKRILFLETSSISSTYKALYDGGGANLVGNEAPFKLKLTGMMFNTTNELIFRESGSKLYSASVGLLNLLADSEIDITTLTFDINASSGVDISHDLVVNGTTASSSYTTGSVVIDGGVGIAKDVWINEDLNVEEITNLDDTNIEGAIKFDATTFDVAASTSLEIDAAAGTIELGVNSPSRPITIGNATSETTVGDNLTVTGTLTQIGTSGFTGLVTADAVTTTGTTTIATIDGNGGAIDATTVGVTTPSTGAFTTLSTTGVTTIGGNVDLIGYELTLDSDKNTSISASSDNIIVTEIGGVDELTMTATAIYPTFDSGLSLGVDASREFLNIYANGTIDAGGALAAGTSLTVGTTAGITGILTTTAAIDANGNIQSSGLYADDGTPQDLDPGAGVNGVINATTTITEFTINGANALTIANGTIQGQKKIVICVKETAGAGTLAGGNFVGTSVTLDAVGSSIQLVWDNTGSDWYMVGAPNGGTYLP